MPRVYLVARSDAMWDNQFPGAALLWKQDDISIWAQDGPDAYTPDGLTVASTHERFVSAMAEVIAHIQED